MDLPAKDNRKIQKDGKQKKLEIKSMKRKRFGKAGKCQLTEIEEAILQIQTRRKEELAEMEMNLGMKKMRSEKHGRVAGKPWVKKAGKGTESTSKKIPEGRKW